MYMKTHILTNQEVALLFSLRTKTVKSFKAIFSKLNNKNTTCPFCDTEDDTQEPALNCDEMNNYYSYTYNNIYSENISEQTEITIHFQSILEKRDQLGTTLDHSTHLGAAAIHSNIV